MATQEIDIAVPYPKTTEDTPTVAAADNTLSGNMSLHWDDSKDKQDLEHGLELMLQAYREHQVNDTP